MDYSTSINDADNPAGASPWGSSPVASPQHARTSSFPTPSDISTSPTPYSTSNSGHTEYSQEDTMGSGGYHRSEGSAGTESVTESDGHRPDTADSVRNQPPPNQQEQTPVQQYQNQPHRTEPARYHPGARQAQHPPQSSQAPQYKLQAKITGLERTGRKDPILRFDVHVCL